MAEDLVAAVQAARRRWSEGGSHSSSSGNRPPVAVGTQKPQLGQILTVDVPTVPTVPTDTDDDERMSGDAPWEAWEERAAILEFDGGLDRGTAERLAQHGY